MEKLTEVSSNKSFGGYQKVFSHQSAEVGCKMIFGVYLPPQCEAGAKVPVLYFLSGLTCTHENFIFKSGFQRYASELGLIVVNPDTSPRGCNIEGEDDSYDFGSGAGFYVDATQEKWAKSYRMYSYVTSELPKLMNEAFGSMSNGKSGITGHSMGGHGALVCGLRNPQLYRSISAFAPIVNPVNCPWGQKAFSGYLGDDKTKWSEYDATDLASKYSGENRTILIDQGDKDDFLETQLKPKNFQDAVVKSSSLTLNLRMQKVTSGKELFVMTTEEIVKLGKKLDKFAEKNGQISESSVLEYLRRLETFNITLEVLQKTRIGMKVNSLRKVSDNGEITSLAKKLVKTWKKLLDKSKDSGSKGGLGSENGNTNDGMMDTGGDSNLEMNTPSASQDAVDSGIDSQQSSSVPEKKPNINPVSSQGPMPSRAATTSDSIRLKSRELLLNSLKAGEMPHGTLDPEDLADQIEDAIFKQFRVVDDPKYKACVRSRVFNLRDKKNLELRLNVLTGVISPEKLAVMTSEEMASPEMKKMRDKFTKEAIDEHQIATDTGTPTDLFKCGKCGGKNCTYTQAQTRSADEPMTTFVFCKLCGNRWKFS